MCIDGYQIEELIHTSPTSRVFLVQDQLTGRELVMKAPSVDLKHNIDYAERFYREEWVGRRLLSPYVAVVHDSGKKRSFLYYMMEKVQGITLAEWIKNNPSPDLDVVIDLLKKIVTGIRVFHRLEMLHRDISPQNIMLGLGKNIKILDFGSVKIAGIEEITHTREIISFRDHRHYAAAELLLGGETDKRVDIYSVGVIAYQMLTGRLPYGDQLKRKLNWNTLNKIEYRSAIQYNPAIPLWLDAAIEKAVKLDMNSRYESFEKFLFDLEYPNPEFSHRKKPAQKNDSSMLWKVLALVLFFSNLVLLFFLRVFDVMD
jgi:serine/threonine protein kinase